MATRSTNPGRLAGAIAGQIRQHKAATVAAVGPHASYNAVKAIVYATEYVKETLKGDSLAVRPEKMVITPNKDDIVKSTGLTLHVQLVPSVSFADEPEMKAAADTNVGLLAGLMADRFKKGPVVTVGGMGANAVSVVLKATMIAQKNMQTKLGTDHVLALVPRFTQVNEDDLQKMRLTVACTKVPKS